MTSYKKVAITTLGCKVNQFESASFAAGFVTAGCELVPFSTQADIYVINTCTVTGRAAQQSRQLIRRAIRKNPQARIVVTGCYAQMAPDEVIDIAETGTCLIGNGYKHLLVETALKEDAPDLVMLIGKITGQRNICHLPVRHHSGRTRAYLRIQDGCSNFCSYCIVPYTRGPSRSLELSRVMKQAEVYAEEGFNEMVITGINVGKYGLDLPENETLCTLLGRLCKGFAGMRIRLSSIEPVEVNDSLLELFVTHHNLMPHLHIPLQSGDDDILRKMYRTYTARSFHSIINAVHNTLPDAAIGCDVMAGFPGETEQQAENTLALLENLPVSYLHIFPYAKRPGTLAAHFQDQVPASQKGIRVKRLRDLDKKLRNHFVARHLNTSRPVLVERRYVKTNQLQGFSDNYIFIHFPGAEKMIHKTVKVTIQAITDGKVVGTIDPLDENKQIR